VAPTCRSSRRLFPKAGAILAIAIAVSASTLADAAEPRTPQEANVAGPVPDAKGTSLAQEHRRRYDDAKKLYDQGHIGEAIAMWEAIYRELHPSGAFRLAYNLGVAHLDLGDVTQAAERFETFLAEFEVRNVRNELTAEEVAQLSPLAERTKTKLTELRISRGRIQVNAPAVAVVAKVGGMPPRVSGFTAWVSPGTYTVVFGEGTSTVETKVVTVKAGELVEITPTPPPPEIVTKEIVTRILTKRPFSPAFIYVAGALTVASVTTAIYGNVRYREMEARRDARVDSSQDADILSSAATARTLGNVGLGATIAAGTITAGLAAYYFLGSKELHETKRPVIVVAPTQGGAMAGFHIALH
jgi:hypothetical protein